MLGSGLHNSEVLNLCSANSETATSPSAPTGPNSEKERPRKVIKKLGKRSVTWKNLSQVQQLLNCFEITFLYLSNSILFVQLEGFSDASLLSWTLVKHLISLGLQEQSAARLYPH